MAFATETHAASVNIDLALEGDKVKFANLVANEVLRVANLLVQKHQHRITNLSHSVTVFGDVALVTVVCVYHSG